MHELIFRIHKIFQQLSLLRMIQFFFNLNRIYLSDWGPAKNHAPIQPPSPSLQIFQTILQPAVAYPGQRPFDPRATPNFNMCLQIFIHAFRHFPLPGWRVRWPWHFRRPHLVHGHFKHPWSSMYYLWKWLFLSGCWWWEFSIMA